VALQFGDRADYGVDDAIYAAEPLKENLRPECGRSAGVGDVDAGADDAAPGGRVVEMLGHAGIVERGVASV